MKELGLITLTLTVITFSCQQTRNQDHFASDDSLSNDKIETKWTQFDVGKVADSSDLPKELEKFEMTFEYEDKEQDSKQTLVATWLTSDSIEFRLITENDICGTDYWGNAKNKYADMNRESDEDENGDSYFVSEYVTEEENYLLRIRISLNKDRARIIFVDKSGEDTDCVPTPNLVLVKKNAH